MNDPVAELLSSTILRESSLSDPIRYARIMKVIRSEPIKTMAGAWEPFRSQRDDFNQSVRFLEELDEKITADNFVRRNRKESEAAGMNLGDLFEDFRRSGRGVSPVSFLLSLDREIFRLLDLMVKAEELMTSATVVDVTEQVDRLKGEMDEAGVNQDVIKQIMSQVGQKRADALQSLALEQSLNRGATAAFMSGLTLLGSIRSHFPKLLKWTLNEMAEYFAALMSRHQEDGVAILKAPAPLGREPSPSSPEFPVYVRRYAAHQMRQFEKLEKVDDVILTDLLLLIWNNLDKMGEIENGTDRNELSQYTIQRARALISAFRSSPAFLDEIRTLKDTVLDRIEVVFQLALVAEVGYTDLTLAVGDRPSYLDRPLTENFETFKRELKLLDFSQINHRSPSKMLSKTEKFARDHQEKALQRLCDLVMYGDTVEQVVKEVLDLKVEERKFLYDANGFFVCKIGNGNQFAGVAPGALEVIPGERPNATLADIWGSGYAELRDFVAGSKEAEKWANLFLVTSPSQSTDKNNILLVGPQGCGKTQVMRAMATQDDSIAIFAVGSDFMTCWLGEAQKNPKRMFDHAIRIRKTSGKHVHILIDEIDVVLASPESASRSTVDLSTEFQNLMDGVVAYPGITIWGATNHPNRIPSPMLRRFSKVMIVGEMSQDDREKTLRHYIESFMPVEEGLDSHYDKWAAQLNGATGDIIRKVIDETWLKLMRGFVAENPVAAEEIAKDLQGLNVLELSGEDKASIRDRIGKHKRVTYAMVEEALDKTLANFAIQRQIEVAKQTYASSHQMFTRNFAGTGTTH